MIQDPTAGQVVYSQDSLVDQEAKHCCCRWNASVSKEGEAKVRLCHFEVCSFTNAQSLMVSWMFDLPKKENHFDEVSEYWSCSHPMESWGTNQLRLLCGKDLALHNLEFIMLSTFTTMQS